MKPFIKENKGGEGDAQNDMLPKQEKKQNKVRKLILKKIK